MWNKVSSWLSAQGVNVDSVFKFQFGEGVVHNVAKMAIFAFIAIAIIGYGLNDDTMKFICVLGVLFVLLILAFKIIGFAKECPDQAMLGGAQFFAARQAQLGTKELPSAPVEASIANPHPSMTAFNAEGVEE